MTPPAVEESWSWGEEPAGPLAAPEYAGPDDADYGDLIQAIAVGSLGAYNEPATRDAAVDSAIMAFVSLDADDQGQGQGGGEMYAETREGGEEGGGIGGGSSPGGYPGGWWNPGNWLRGLWTGDPNCPDDFYRSATQYAGEESYAKNPARTGLRRLGDVDPTGLAEATDAVLTGLEEGESPLTTAGSAVLSLAPGPSPKKASKGARVVANAAEEGADGVRKTTRKSSKQIRKEMEEATGQKWPRDPKTGRNHDVAHKKALADGGTNELNNIEPKRHDIHVQEHMDNGDFVRWGKRRGRNSGTQ